VLLKHAADPGALFVNTVKLTSRDASYCRDTFYRSWRLAIQRDGIHNPYTGRGAIKGLRPVPAAGQGRTRRADSQQDLGIGLE